MQKLTSLAILMVIGLGAFLILATSPATAAFSQSAGVSASVDEVFDLDIKMQQFQKPPGGTESPTGNATLLGSMNFGKLIFDKDSSGKLQAGRGQFYYKVWIGVRSNHGKTYTIKHTAQPMMISGSGEKIPDGAFICVPMHLDADNVGNFDNAGKVGDAGTAVTDKLIYTGIKSQTAQVVYALSGDPNSGINNAAIPGWVPISSDQKTGNYSTTITITLTD